MLLHSSARGCVQNVTLRSHWDVVNESPCSHAAYVKQKLISSISHFIFFISFVDPTQDGTRCHQMSLDHREEHIPLPRQSGTDSVYCPPHRPLLLQQMMLEMLMMKRRWSCRGRLIRTLSSSWMDAIHSSSASSSRQHFSFSSNWLSFLRTYYEFLLPTCHIRWNFDALSHCRIYTATLKMRFYCIAEMATTYGYIIHGCY